MGLITPSNPALSGPGYSDYDQIVPVQYDTTAQTLLVNGAPLASGGGSGTVNTGTAGQLAAYASNGTAVSGLSIVPVSAGGNGTATPAIVAGTNVTVTGSWPNQTVNATAGGGSGTVNSGGTGQVAYYAANGTAVSGETLVPIAAGGTGTATPSIVAGTNVTVTGSWPNQTINSTAAGGSGTVNTGSANQLAYYSAGGTAVSGVTTIPTAALAALTGVVTSAAGSATTAFASSTGSGAVVLATSPTLVTPVLGTPTSGVLTNLTGLPLTTGVTGILPVANGGTATATPSIVAGTNVTVTGTWPNQTVNASGSGSVGPANTPGYGAAVVTDSAPAATLSNYAPTGWGSTISELRMNPTAPTTLTSLSSTSRTQGSTVHLINYNASNTITITHQGTGTAGNQFLCAGNSSITLAPNASIFAVLDVTSGSWRLA